MPRFVCRKFIALRVGSNQFVATWDRKAQRMVGVLETEDPGAIAAIEASKFAAQIVEEDAAPAAPRKDLDEMTYAELMGVAKPLGLAWKSRATKAVVVEAIRQAWADRDATSEGSGAPPAPDEDSHPPPAMRRAAKVGA